MILNLVVHDSKCTTTYSISVHKKDPFIYSLNEIRYITPTEEPFRTRIRCFQHSLEIVNVLPLLCTIYYFMLPVYGKFRARR